MRGISPAERKIFSRHLLGNLLTGNKARVEKVLFFQQNTDASEKSPSTYKAVVFAKIKK